MEYYSAIKSNKIALFLEMWMNLKSVIQREVSRNENTQIYINACMWNLGKWYR